jgi:hypothetical protein
VRIAERCLCIGGAPTAEQKPPEPYRRITCTSRVATPIERTQRCSERSFGGSMTPAHDEALNVSNRLSRARVDERPGAVHGATFCCFHDVGPFRLRPSLDRAELSNAKLAQSQ